MKKRSTYPYPTERIIHWLEDGSGNNDMEGSFGAAWLNIISVGCAVFRVKE